MAAQNYWLGLVTGKTWREFLDAGGTVMGFREGREARVRQLQPGDVLLCYLTGISRWIGILEVTSAAFYDRTRIWSGEVFPWRVRVRKLVTLTPETAVPVLELRDQLSIFRNLKHPHAWGVYFRGSPARWDPDDAKAVIRAVENAAAHPVTRPVAPRALERRPETVRTAIGSVTIPDREDSAAADAAQGTAAGEAAEAPSLHTEIQWRLLQLGAAMGFDVWVARNDRHRAWQGQPFSDVPRLRREFPRQFDEAISRTIQMIDVLWLQGNAVAAAFEVENTTSIYSGLLRMADLLAMQPNLNIRLYLVAPDERRQKVLEEVNRPTFSRLSPPLAEVCRFIGFTTLREWLVQLGDLVQHLKLSFMENISEPCTLEEA